MARNNVISMVTVIKGMTTGGEKIRMIKTDEIETDPLKAQRTADDRSLIFLKDSIHRHGILVPLTVRPGEKGYRLISGSRRLRAASELGIRAVPCVVLPADDELCAEFALIESMQRRDLDMFEQAEAISKLMSHVGLNCEQTARQLSCSTSCVANKLRLLRFDEEEREAIRKNGLTERHARALLRIGDRDTRMSFIREISARGMSVSETEERIGAALAVIAGNKNGNTVINTRKTDMPAVSSARTGCKRTVNTLKPFENTLQRALNALRLAGVNATFEKSDGDGFTTFSICIPTSITKAG